MVCHGLCTGCSKQIHRTLLIVLVFKYTGAGILRNYGKSTKFGTNIENYEQVDIFHNWSYSKSTLSHKCCCKPNTKNSILNFYLILQQFHFVLQVMIQSFIQGDSAPRSNPFNIPYLKRKVLLPTLEQFRCNTFALLCGRVLTLAVALQVLLTGQWYLRNCDPQELWHFISHYYQLHICGNLWFSMGSKNVLRFNYLIHSFSTSFIRFLLPCFFQ